MLLFGKHLRDTLAPALYSGVARTPSGRQHLQGAVWVMRRLPLFEKNREKSVSDRHDSRFPTTSLWETRYPASSTASRFQLALRRMFTLRENMPIVT
jgi:hypothetical protein